MDEGIGAWLDVDPGLLECPEVGSRDVLVVEGHDVEVLGKVQERLQVFVVSHRGSGHRGDGRDVLTFRQDSKFEAESSRGWGHHSGKLAAANYTYYWKSHICQPTENRRRTRLPAVAESEIRGNADPPAGIIGRLLQGSRR